MKSAVASDIRHPTLDSDRPTSTSDGMGPSTADDGLSVLLVVGFDLCSVYCSILDFFHIILDISGNNIYVVIV